MIKEAIDSAMAARKEWERTPHEHRLHLISFDSALYNKFPQVYSIQGRGELEKVLYRDAPPQGPNLTLFILLLTKNVILSTHIGNNTYLSKTIHTKNFYPMRVNVTRVDQSERCISTVFPPGKVYPTGVNFTTSC